MSEEQQGFKVTDRRIHASEAGESDGDGAAAAAEQDAAGDGAADTAADGADAPPAEERAEAAAGDRQEERAAGQADGAGATSTPIPMSFATFVVSLGESAWIHLGLVPNPVTGERENDLAMARQTIDILGILEEKTKGNLDEEEEKLLRNLLYTLRLHFVQVEAESNKTNEG